MSSLSFAADRRIHLILQPAQLSGLQLRNRIVVAPMTRVSATAHGVPTAHMASYYADFARGGFGLILSEGIFPEPTFGRAYERQPGLVTPAQVEGWRAVTDAVHEAGGLIFAQLMHAGALSQCLDATLGPSAIHPRGAKMPEYGGSGSFPVPREMDRSDIEVAVQSFTRAAELALASGFDGIEIHGANGYLIDQFLTDYTNRRTDEYGGDVRARTRFASEVLRAVRSAVGAQTVVGIRLSQTKVNDFVHRWPGGLDDAEIIFEAVRAAGASYIHIAGEGRVWAHSAQLVGTRATVTQVARRVAQVPVIANGGLHDPDLADSLLEEGHADLISIGRAAIANPDWPRRLQYGDAFAPFQPEMIEPEATIENTARWLNMGAASTSPPAGPLDGGGG